MAIIKQAVSVAATIAVVEVIVPIIIVLIIEDSIRCNLIIVSHLIERI